jgi:type I restriction enzyme S subunit
MPISFVPMESVNEIYAEINDNKNCIVAGSKGFTRFQEGDLLWAKITPCMENGKSAVAKDLINGYGCGSTEFHVIRPKNNDLLVEYIHTLLHMKIVRQTAKLYFGGSAGQQRVATDFLESFNVPLPSKTKQQDIVNYITNIRTRAKALQAEGKTILENAKRKVEQMIIGK